MNPLDPLRRFLRLEAAAGIVLVLAMAAAIVTANSPLADVYDGLLDVRFAVTFDGVGIDKPLLLWELEHALHPYVSYGVLPLFAFANSGLSLAGVDARTLLSRVPLGIAVGLFLGKQVGVFGTAWVLVKLRAVALPAGSTWLGLYGVAILTGIGFTMSLFIGGDRKSTRLNSSHQSVPRMPSSA